MHIVPINVLLYHFGCYITYSVLLMLPISICISITICIYCLYSPNHLSSKICLLFGNIAQNNILNKRFLAWLRFFHYFLERCLVDKMCLKVILVIPVLTSVINPSSEPVLKWLVLNVSETCEMCMQKNSKFSKIQDFRNKALLRWESFIFDKAWTVLFYNGICSTERFFVVRYRKEYKRV